VCDRIVDQRRPEEGKRRRRRELHPLGIGPEISAGGLRRTSPGTSRRAGAARSLASSPTPLRCRAQIPDHCLDWGRKGQEHPSSPLQRDQPHGEKLCMKVERCSSPAPCPVKEARPGSASPCRRHEQPGRVACIDPGHRHSPVRPVGAGLGAPSHGADLVPVAANIGDIRPGACGGQDVSSVLPMVSAARLRAWEMVGLRGCGDFVKQRRSARSAWSGRLR
jgi:hypothetical protein